MAFQARFYTFSKKRNSTARPAANGGSPYNCLAKQPMDIINPRLQLQLAGGATATPHAWNYCYIAAFGRYYYVTGWTNKGPLWECSLAVDALASWRANIGAQSLYVFRSSATFDGHVVDRLYPPKTDIVTKYVNFDSGMTGGDDISTMFYSVGLIGKTTGTYYRYFTPVQLDALITGILSDGFYDAMLGEFGATEYPEAKVAINPLEYITSIRAYPYPIITDAVAHTGLVIANVQVPNAECYIPNDSLYTAQINIDISTIRHPQAAARGPWVNAEHGTYTLQMPGWGLVSLPATYAAKYPMLQLNIIVDTTTGDALLRGSFYSTEAGVEGTGEVFQLATRIGVDLPVSRVIVGGYSAMSALRDLLPVATGAIGGLITGNPLAVAGALGGTVSAIGNAVASQVPHVNQISQQGSLVNINGMQSAVYGTFTLLANDDNAGRGRPLCGVRRLSDIPGYIMADPDEVSIAATESELQAIRAAIAGGFFYE